MVVFVGMVGLAVSCLRHVSRMETTTHTRTGLREMLRSDHFSHRCYLVVQLSTEDERPSKKLKAEDPGMLLWIRTMIQMSIAAGKVNKTYDIKRCR
ncbi:hypothetical protein Taro_020561 [Colocasia esculenta]|uniref:Uncharacterized protein n=1 Tax=Colocasia esculenta TaxID=4460 RepID=A0A843V8T8_COLES|nr:hypothetical protein [Colocasia esculenta]